MEERVPFVESQLGGGPFHAVFTRGPLLWQLWTSQAKQGSRVTTASENQVRLERLWRAAKCRNCRAFSLSHARSSRPAFPTGPASARALSSSAGLAGL